MATFVRALVAVQCFHQLDDRKGREDVVVLLSVDGKPLSEEQLRIWVDNFRSSLKRKKSGEE